MRCLVELVFLSVFVCFFNDTATTEIYTLSLHDALPILQVTVRLKKVSVGTEVEIVQAGVPDVIPPEACYLGWQESLRNLARLDRKSTRLNSSHANISYAVFCLKKKNKHTPNL